MERSAEQPQRALKRGVDRQQPARLVAAVAVVDPEVVALAGHDHVVVAVEAELGGRTGHARREARRGRPTAPPGFPCRRRRRPCAGTRTPRPRPACPAWRPRGAGLPWDAGWTSGRASHRLRRARPRRPGLRDRSAPDRRYEGSPMPCAGPASCPRPARRAGTGSWARPSRPRRGPPRPRREASPPRPRCVRAGRRGGPRPGSAPPPRRPPGRETRCCHRRGWGRRRRPGCSRSVRGCRRRSGPRRRPARPGPHRGRARRSGRGRPAGHSRARRAPAPPAREGRR